MIEFKLGSFEIEEGAKHLSAIVSPVKNIMRQKNTVRSDYQNSDGSSPEEKCPISEKMA